MPRLRGSRDLSAGLCLLALAGVASVRGAELPLGTLRQIGPGMVPRALALLVGSCGAALSVRGVWGVNQPAAPNPAAAATASTAPSSVWHDSVRAPLCLLGAASAFALLVRPLGLAVAGPLTISLATLASREVKWRESLLFAFGMTIACVVLFRYLLSLPLPIAPWLIGY